MSQTQIFIVSCLLLTTSASPSPGPGPGPGPAIGDGGSVSYFGSDWNALMGGGGRATQPTCVDIPRNMTLCHGISYSQMRLPNLLEHDTLSEAQQQSKSWVPLINLKCHPDTQLFLCSLFSPVCLDRPIYPCRSLCEKVMAGCEGRMRAYGYPWPDILKCDKFPLDNDMCITAQSGSHSDGGACAACNQIGTYENIMDHFCRADFAIKTKIRKLKKSKLICKKSKILKAGKMEKKDLRQIRRPTFVLDELSDCCNGVGREAKTNYLMMGNKRGSDLVPTFIMEWQGNSAIFRNTVRKFKGFDCFDPKIVSASMLTDGTGTGTGTSRLAGNPSNEAIGRQPPPQPSDILPPELTPQLNPPPSSAVVGNKSARRSMERPLKLARKGRHQRGGSGAKNSRNSTTTSSTLPASETS